ncbi:MAG: hypothetical protein J3K34DRAFT_265560 [Monoraphidium minutum]|nr:MAG: hypothetical protein J3K34DRAFT_265560 [Monoraphidium minutum]
MEAMAMELPVISTNWSGLTEFLSEDVAYPLAIDGLIKIENKNDPQFFGAFEGQSWAQPSEPHLRELLRRVASRPGEAAAKGAAARRMVAERYTPAVLARSVERHVRRIQAALLASAGAPGGGARRGGGGWRPKEPGGGGGGDGAPAA